MNATQLLHDLGQSIGLNNMTRDLLDSGRPQHYVVAPGWRRPSHHLRGTRLSLSCCGSDQRRTPGADICRGCAGVPPAAEGSIQPDDIEQFVTLELGEVQFRIKQIPFGIEYLQVAIDAPEKTHIGERHAVLEGPDQQSLLHTLFPAFLIADQRV